MDTKNMIVDAACRVFRQYPFDRVTVQKIIDEAGVSRSSFYKYFKDKFDVVEWFCLHNIERIYDKATADPARVDYLLINREMNHISHEYADMYRILYLKDPEHTLDRCLEESIYQTALAALSATIHQPVSESMRATALCCATGICRLLREWTLGRLNIDEEEFTSITNWLLTYFIKYHLPEG